MDKKQEKKKISLEATYWTQREQGGVGGDSAAQTIVGDTGNKRQQRKN